VILTILYNEIAFENLNIFNPLAKNQWPLSHYSTWDLNVVGDFLRCRRWSPLGETSNIVAIEKQLGLMIVASIVRSCGCSPGEIVVASIVYLYAATRPRYRKNDMI
jgi:hypothetical protein